MTAITPGDKPNELKVFEHGFVRLDSAMADDLSVVNSARVSFAVRKENMDDRDKGLISFLMRDRHGTPFEHNSFRFHIRTPIFVAREWFRHRIGCLTGDAVVTFVDVNGSTTPRLKKTIEELYCLWHFGEQDGHSLSETEMNRIDDLGEQGESIRSIARKAGRGRRAITRHLEGLSGLRDARGRVRRMRLRVLNEETNEFETGHISDVVDQGVQPVFDVTLADGKRLRMTSNHRILTSEGWRTLAEAVGLQGVNSEARVTRQAFLLTNGTPVYQDRDWLKAQRASGASVTEIAERGRCNYHTIRKWLRKHDHDENKGYKVNRSWTPEWKSAIRRARSGPNSNFWRGGLSTERQNIARWTREQAAKVHARFDYVCQCCNRRGGKLHAHHLVPVWFDQGYSTTFGNLVSVCEECHRAIHRTMDSELAFMRENIELLDGGLDIQRFELPQRKGVKLTAHPVEITSVEYVGLCQTFDLCVEGPWHNFVANGMVVHNSFNEESARYHKLADDFYVPEPEAVRGQVGKPGAYTFEPTDEKVAHETIDTFRRVYKELYAEYQNLIERGVAKELARAVLPFGIFTQFYWTINARALMNFISLRNSEFAQYEIRVYADAVERLFAQQMPITHECFVEFGRKGP